MSADISQQPGILGEPKLQLALERLKTRHGEYRLTTEQALCLALVEIDALLTDSGNKDQCIADLDNRLSSLETLVGQLRNVDDGR